VIKLTSGSVGAPRGVAASEAHLWEDATRVIEAMDIRPTDVHLASIPISHSYGLGNLVLPTLALGASVVLRAPRRPEAFVEDVTRFGVSVFPATPHIFDHLMDRHPHRTASSLRLLISAGAPLRPGTIERVRAGWGLKVHSFYGTTETGGIAYDAGEAVPQDGYVGTPLPRTSLELRPEASDAPGTGRILVRSGAVGAGYISPAGTDSGGFISGGFLTGDLGTLTDDGGLRLLGRVAGFINVGGLKVDPAEVESTVRALPGVTGVLVIGTPCRSHGEDVVAVLSAVPGVSAGDVESFCRAKLSRHKVPRRVVVVERLPLTRRGKVDRAAVDALVAGDSCPQQRQRPAGIAPEP
jgi:long-chain acyl-CoA synthetase